MARTEHGLAGPKNSSFEQAEAATTPRKPNEALLALLCFDRNFLATDGQACMPQFPEEKSP